MYGDEFLSQVPIELTWTDTNPLLAYLQASVPYMILTPVIILLMRILWRAAVEGQKKATARAAAAAAAAPARPTDTRPRCEYCGTLRNEDSDNCPNCGGKW